MQQQEQILASISFADRQRLQEMTDKATVEREGTEVYVCLYVCLYLKAYLCVRSDRFATGMYDV